MPTQTAHGLRDIQRARYVEPVIAFFAGVILLAGIGVFVAWMTAWHPWVCLGLFAMCALCVAPMSWKLFGALSKIAGN